MCVSLVAEATLTTRTGYPLFTPQAIFRETGSRRDFEMTCGFQTGRLEACTQPGNLERQTGGADAGQVPSLTQSPIGAWASTPATCSRRDKRRDN